MGYFRPLSQTKFINDANLVSYWKLDGNSNDSKGSNNGTDTNMSYSVGKFDSAGDFNGSSSKIVLPNLGVSGSTARTISVWVKYSDIVDGAIYCSGTNSANAAFQINTSSYDSGGLSFYLNSQDYKSPASVVTTGVWYNIVATYDGGTASTSTLHIYLNGNALSLTKVGTGTGTLNTTNSNYGIGANPADSSGFLNGQIDDTAIFSRALSAGEVAELYQSMTLGEYLPNSSTKLLLHLNGSSADSSGNNNIVTDTAITYGLEYGKFGQGILTNNSTSVLTTTAVGLTNTSDFIKLFRVKLNSEITSSEIYLFIENFPTNKYCHLRYQYNSGTRRLNLEYGLGTNAIYNINLGTSEWLIGAMKSGNNIYIIINNKIVASGVVGTSGGNGSNVLTLFNNNNSKNDEVIIENMAWKTNKLMKYFTYTKGRFGII